MPVAQRPGQFGKKQIAPLFAGGFRVFRFHNSLGGYNRFTVHLAVNFAGVFSVIFNVTFSIGFQQRRNAFGRLGAMTKPIIDTADINPDFFFLPLGDRVEKSQALNVTTIASVALIRYDNVIEGAFFCPTAGQSDADHGSILTSKK
jgi:hypothetical protein